MTAQAILATISTKVCTKCGEYKQAFGTRNICIPCRKAYDREKSATMTPQQRKEKYKKLAAKMTPEQRHIRNEKERARVAALSEEKRLQKRLLDNARIASLSLEARQKRNDSLRAYAAAMPPEKKKQRNARKASLFLKSHCERLNSDPVYRFSFSVKNLVRKSFKRKGYTKRSKSQEIIGCDWIFFKAHIERQFLKGMSWELMGNEIHLDHITPLVTAKTIDDVISLNHFTNLRPMWAKDNLSKGVRITNLI